MANPLSKIDLPLAVLIFVFLILFIGIEGEQPVVSTPVVSTVAATDKAPSGIVTFTFDDGSVSQHAIGLQKAFDYGVTGTFLVNTKYVNEAETIDDNWTMTWDQVRDFRDAGWEIGSHGFTHSHLPELSRDEISEEIDRARSDIITNTGVDPVSFAAPFGDIDETVMSLVKERHAINLLAGSASFGRTALDKIDPLMIGRISITDKTDPSAICGNMLEAARNGEWMVLMFHEFVEGEAEIYQVSADTYDKILSCARFLANEGLIRIETVQQAIATTTSDQPDIPD